VTLAERIARIYAGKWSTASEKFPLPYHTLEGHNVSVMLDVIMKVTHGATRNRLANGSVATMKCVANLQESYPNAKLFFSTYSRNPEGANEKNWVEKMLPSATHVGSIPTTSAEAKALRAFYDEIDWYPWTMLIVTDEFNSRRTRDIYRLYFPETNIFILAIPIAKTHDPESPILNFRNMNRAILWETLIPLIPFWVLTHSGDLGKRILEWLSYRVAQASAS